MVNSPDSPHSTPEASTRLSLKDIVSRDGIYGLILCVIACILALVAFWRLSGNSSDMLIITDYVIEVPVRTEKNFWLWRV